MNRPAQGETLLNEFRVRLEPIPAPARRPRVYFEEWNDPLITSIAWVSELIERAGGEDIFSALRSQNRAPDRVVTSDQVIAANPEIIFTSWCGKPVSVESIVSRRGWSNLSAVQHRQIYELRGADILQPGFGLIRGYEEMKRHLHGLMLACQP
jgi:iron complex transport system substrate-binding protein